ncbi:TPA: hypothetical protein NNR24_004454 [Salmonella enterica]|nr:hypothetical protein [Salmonella enterica]HCH8522533.1 hypothetical protein [Salmonella enterica]HCH8758443.1 hypothetical protein [Salmonella enterica]HCH8762986.1 hypothetical protein [Salmonella enterica]HCH9029293.1 hypothetical protein [Salmonella enterica]
MKRKNCVVGQRVKVKKKSFGDRGYFYETRRGETGVIERIDSDGDVHVTFDKPELNDDWGKPYELKKVKGDAS